MVCEGGGGIEQPLVENPAHATVTLYWQLSIFINLFKKHLVFKFKNKTKIRLRAAPATKHCLKVLFFFFQNLQAKSAELAGYETKLNNLHLKVDSCKYVNLYLTILTLWMLNTFSVDVMDFAGLKAINEESLAVKRNLNNEIEKVSNSFVCYC